MASSSSSASSSAALGERQAFSKPGQAFSTPSPGSADRVFYETLLAEKPESEMALDWCIKHGTSFEGADTNAMISRLAAVRQKSSKASSSRK